MTNSRAQTLPIRARQGASAAHGGLGQRAGHAPRPRDRSPFVFWGKKKVAIDLFHHAVYAAATGLTYSLVDR
jgi:hypothetical protein